MQEKKTVFRLSASITILSILAVFTSCSAVEEITGDVSEALGPICSSLRPLVSASEFGTVSDGNSPIRFGDISNYWGEPSLYETIWRLRLLGAQGSELPSGVDRQEMVEWIKDEIGSISGDGATRYASDLYDAALALMVVDNQSSPDLREWVAEKISDLRQESAYVMRTDDTDVSFEATAKIYDLLGRMGEPRDPGTTSLLTEIVDGSVEGATYRDQIWAAYALAVYDDVSSALKNQLIDSYSLASEKFASSLVGIEELQDMWVLKKTADRLGIVTYGDPKIDSSQLVREKSGEFVLKGSTSTEPQINFYLFGILDEEASRNYSTGAIARGWVRVFGPTLYSSSYSYLISEKCGWDIEASDDSLRRLIEEATVGTKLDQNELFLLSNIVKVARYVPSGRNRDKLEILLENIYENVGTPTQLGRLIATADNFGINRDNWGKRDVNELRTSSIVDEYYLRTLDPSVIETNFRSEDIEGIFSDYLSASSEGWSKAEIDRSLESYVSAGYVCDDGWGVEGCEHLDLLSACAMVYLASYSTGAAIL